MFKSIILTVAMMTAPFVADAQWIAHKKTFKKVNEHTLVSKNFSHKYVRGMIIILLNRNSFWLDTMIFDSKGPVFFYHAWETSSEVKTMAVVKNENNRYDIYLFHHPREEKFYFTADGLNYGYMP